SRQEPDRPAAAGAAAHLGVQSIASGYHRSATAPPVAAGGRSRAVVVAIGTEPILTEPTGARGPARARAAAAPRFRGRAPPAPPGDAELPGRAPPAAAPGLISGRCTAGAS